MLNCWIFHIPKEQYSFHQMNLSHVLPLIVIEKVEQTHFIFLNKRGKIIILPMNTRHDMSLEKIPSA